MLSEQQKKFADLFIQTGNAKQSYIDAGYKASGNGAEVNASRLLRNAKVKEYIDKVVNEKSGERIAKQDEVLEYLTKIMRGETTEQTMQGLGGGLQQIANIEVSAKDRIKAAELLGKRYAIWTDKKELEGNLGITIVDDIDED